MKTQHFDVIELRRYRLKAGAGAQFSRYFDTWFPEAFQQLGAITFGHFLEREQADRFTWLRGYRDMAARLTVNEAFYDGPVWQEHKAQLNGLMVDSDDVLLMRPLHSDSAPPALPAVDPFNEPQGAHGIGVAHIIKLAPRARLAGIAAAETCFGAYQGRGVTELGILATLEEPNNFPRHPIRNDGYYLVWLGMLRDEAALASLRTQCTQAAQMLSEAGVLDGEVEFVVLDPGRRSRLRWMGAQTLARSVTLELAA